MVPQMLNDTHMRARVFLTKAEFSGARAERLSTATTLPAASTLQDALSPTLHQKHQAQATQAEHGSLPFLRNQLPRLSEVAQHLRAALQGDERDLPAGQRECCTYAVASALQQAEDVREQLETTLCALALTLSFSEAQALHRMLTALSERLDDWLEFDEGCTCDESEPEELCLSCASLEAQSSASQWLQALALVLAPGCAATTEEKGG
jgi:hypothetical protein